MATYSIDDQHGTNICGGIQLEHRAREIAQKYANDLGAPVHLYSSDEGDEGETIEPDNGRTTADSITDDQIRKLRREALDAGDLMQACICEIALGGDGSDAEPGTDMAIAASVYRQTTARAECARVISDAEAQS